MAVVDTGWRGYIKRPNSRLNMFGNDALEKLLRDYQFTTVLDIGCGAGQQADIFKQRNKAVTTIDMAARKGFSPDYIGDYLHTQFGRKFDAIWCCHVLEHVFNVNAFLAKLKSDLNQNGILALTVPPAKHDIVSGHVSIWNAGLLLYNLILAGFDCRRAAVRTYGYNVSVIVQNNGNRVPHGVTDIPGLSAFFPIKAFQGFDGRIIEVNW
ncbi:MAG: methyltransferase domain-containing protein [Gammaproteobacteria bacterium]|nr:methyltransferase domain-containing protein [Gammaproteobacteria bacterium]MDH5653064.1 methyltransferase domain-containing protein [Gammaproteobacteria bacterium]